MRKGAMKRTRAYSKEHLKVIFELVDIRPSKEKLETLELAVAVYYASKYNIRKMPVSRIEEYLLRLRKSFVTVNGIVGDDIPDDVQLRLGIEYSNKLKSIVNLKVVDDEPEVQSIMEQAFAAKEDESDFLKRIKNSPRKIVESGVTGIIAERSFQALGMAYRTLLNSPKFKQGQVRSVEDALAEPSESKVLLKMFAR